ncbi:MAG: phage head protein [Rhodobacterales bacterium]|nr:phage head protein [Rhodobacterales bacterium]
MNELLTTFRQPFREQIAAFILRLGNLVPTSRWDQVVREQNDRAWFVAGATKAELLSDLSAATLRIQTEGISLQEFAKDFRAIVEKQGWHGWTGEGTKKGEAWRIRVIYKTNLRVSYMAGRLAQLRDGGFPYWVYFHGGSVEPRLQHLGWNGLVLPADHPFWATHSPPNGWGCSCRVSGAMSLAMARRMGGDPDKALPADWDSIDPRTGAPPGIGKGWDYAPGASISELISATAAKAAKWPDDITRSFMRDQPTALRDSFAKSYRSLPSVADEVRRFGERALGERGGAPITARGNPEPVRTLGLVTTDQQRRFAEIGIDLDQRSIWDFVLERILMEGILRVIEPDELALVARLIDEADSVEEGPDGTIIMRGTVEGRALTATFRPDPRRGSLVLISLMRGIV